MDGTIRLRSSERKALLEQYRRNPNPAVRRRAHIVLLLAGGYPWETIAAMLFCSTRTIGRWKRRFERGRLAVLQENRRGRPAIFGAWWTGDPIVTEGLPAEGRNAALFVRHLDDLRYHLRCYRKIHVIGDNARFHDCRRGWAYLRDWGHRIQLHFLPAYAPEANPIERIWWHLHEEITRNHRRGNLDELLNLVFAWLDHGRPFGVEDQTHHLKPAA